jgi:hypothetical protein
VSDKKQAKPSPEVQRDAEAIWGPRGRIRRVLVDAGLASKGRSGEVRPEEKDQGIVRVAESPDFDEIPRLRDMTILHEAGHLAHGEDLHKGVGKRSFIAKAGPARLGRDPKEQREELDKLKKNPAYADRAYEAMRDQALEEVRQGTGPQGVLRRLKGLLADSPVADEKLSKFVKRRTGKGAQD